MIILPLVVIAALCRAPVAFDVPAGPAESTIVTWSRQANLQVMFDWSQVSGLQSLSVRGTLEPLDALRRMLSATGLEAVYANPHTVAVYVDRCHPELGADAPLPPCKAPPLEIHAP